MEYYKRLAKNKLFSLVMYVVFGIIMLVGAVCGVYIIGNAINQSDTMMIWFGSSLAFFGSVFSYFLLYEEIVTHPYAQVKEDFIVESEGENIHIRYKDYDIVHSREFFGHKIMRDINGKKITTNDRNRIRNVVYKFYPEKLERNLEEKVKVENNEVNYNFQDTRVATNEEKRAYISLKKYNKNPLFIPSILFIMLMTVGIIFISKYENIIARLEQSSNSFSNVVFFVGWGVCILFFASDFFIIKKIANKILINKIMKSNLYITECKIWDKKFFYRQTSDGNNYREYYVKITDGVNVNDEWIEVSKKTYNLVDTELFNEAVLYTIGDGKRAKRDILPR